MQNAAIQEFKEWCIKERDDNLESIKRYESGDFSLKTRTGNNPWVDRTKHQENHARGVVEEMNRIIERIEAEHG